jgi:hypothetical protein
VKPSGVERSVVVVQLEGGFAISTDRIALPSNPFKNSVHTVVLKATIDKLHRKAHKQVPDLRVLTVKG